MKGSGVPYNFETKLLKEVKTPAEFPVGKVYVIQIFKNHSVYHEGDERSRTHPGHGYPAYTENFTTVRQFVTTDEEEWKRSIQALFQAEKSRTDVVALVVDRKSVSTHVVVEI